MMIVDRRVRVVSATIKKTSEEFGSQTLLGHSLSTFPPEMKPEVSVQLDNAGADSVTLSRLYNSFLQDTYRHEIVLFVHDDVYIDDWWLAYRLREAMQHFDVVGVAGNFEPDLAEPSWAVGWNRNKYPNGFQPEERLSGAVAYLSPDKTAFSVQYFGLAPRRCKLLDGLFIAVNVEQVLAKGVRFDEQFRYHFHDLDFCRTAEAKGMRIGTWPIAVTREKRDAHESTEWRVALQQYSDKWPILSGDPAVEGAESSVPQKDFIGAVASLWRKKARRSP